jgi:hypothetical protein
MMPDTWYQVVQAATPITQGDLIFDCPVMTWAAESLTVKDQNEVEALRATSTAIRIDAVVMTQACDLAQAHVDNVILCPHVSLDEYRAAFDEEMRSQGQNPTAKAWKNRCNDIKDGLIWRLAMLNAEDHGDLQTRHRIVDFTEVYSIPRNFIESLLSQRSRPRLTLLPPYREHLSQAFARFFMRVGLPEAVAIAW